jgi:hypothetical protein
VTKTVTAALSGDRAAVKNLAGVVELRGIEPLTS